MEQKICQCCAMPIDESTFGTEADGSKNQDYCLYCYKNGHFTKDCTMDEMIEFNLKYLDEFNKDSKVKYTIDEARATMKEFFPQLEEISKNESTPFPTIRYPQLNNKNYSDFLFYHTLFLLIVFLLYICKCIFCH